MTQQMRDRARRFRRPIGWLALVLMSVGGVSGCDWSPLRGQVDSQGYWLPLTVVLRFDPSVTGAMLDYTDACQQPQTISVGEQLTYLLRHQIGMAFERVRIDSTATKEPVDGELEVSLDLKDIVLPIPRRADKEYPATITLGATVVFRDPTGATRYSKSIRTDFQGEVGTTQQNCNIKGLAEVINDASMVLAQGLKQQLGTSVALNDYAGQREKERGRSEPLPFPRTSR